MLLVPVFYATTNGHTRRIAERLASRLRTRGLAAAAVDVTTRDLARIDWRHTRGAVVVAPVHMGRHPAAMRDFVTAMRDRLAGVPSLFVSVSLDAASAHRDVREATRDIAARFVVETGWTPWRLACVAGALAYTRYNAFVRWYLRRIAAREGGPTDTTRDHDLTDWPGVERLADDFAGRIAPGTRLRVATPHMV